LAVHAKQPGISTAVNGMDWFHLASVCEKTDPLDSLDVRESGIYLLRPVDRQLGKPPLDAPDQPLHPIHGILQTTWTAV
jgi:hypothetical protein